QPHVLLRETDAGNAAAVEGQVVGLNAVAEDHPGAGHVRLDLQALAGFDAAEDLRGGGDLADERLADGVAQVFGVPGEAVALADLLDLGAGHELLDDARRPGEEGAEPAGRPRSRRDDDPAGGLLFRLPPQREAI